MLTDLLGQENTFVKEFKDAFDERWSTGEDVGKGILEAVLEEVENGYITSIKELIHGDLFTDYIDMAEHLLEEGYKDPAAVIVGSSLEAKIRKICEKHNIIVLKSDGKPKSTNMLNNELAKAKIYSKGEHKSIIAWLDLRNSAAHGHYDNYDKAKVELFIMSVRDFINRYPA